MGKGFTYCVRLLLRLIEAGSMLNFCNLIHSQTNGRWCYAGMVQAQTPPDLSSSFRKASDAFPAQEHPLCYSNMHVTPPKMERNCKITPGIILFSRRSVPSYLHQLDQPRHHLCQQ